MGGVAPRVLLAGLAVNAVLRWPSLGSLEAARWPVSFLLWGLALLYVMHHLSVWDILIRQPVVWLVAFATWGLIASRWSPLQPSSFALGFGGLVLVLFGVDYVHRRGWKDFAAVITVSMAAFVVVGWAYTSVVGDVEPTVDGRLSALSNNPTSLGFLATVMGLTALAGFRGRPFVVAGFVGFAGMLLVLAEARMAALGLVLGLLLVLATSSIGLIRTAALGGMAIGACGVVIIVMAGDIASPGLARQDSREEFQTLTGRTQLWEMAGDWYAERPLVGHGLQSSDELYAQAEADGRLEWSARDAHNSLIQTMIELGAIGAVLLVGFTVSYVLANVGLPDPRASAVVLAVGVVGLTESLVQEPTLALLVLAGAGAYAARVRGPRVGVRPGAVTVA